MEERNPIIVAVPISLLATAVRIPLNAHTIVQSTSMLRADGYLAQLVSGSFTVEIRDLFDNRLIGTISWTEPGFATSGDIQGPPLDQETSGLQIGPTSLGVGAGSCTLTIWTLMTF